MTQQLDFFDLLKPTAKVLPFPPRRLLSLIEGAAERVHDAGPDAKQALLNEVGRLMLRYLLAGFDEDYSYQLAQDYRQAVVAEVHRLKWNGRQPDPRGVA